MDHSEGSHSLESSMKGLRGEWGCRDLPTRISEILWTQGEGLVWGLETDGVLKI